MHAAGGLETLPEKFCNAIESRIGSTYIISEKYSARRDAWVDRPSDNVYTNNSLLSMGGVN